MEQELFTLPGHLSSSPVFSGVRVTRSLVLCACLVDRCLSFCPFSFGHCVVCFSSMYGFWLRSPPWLVWPLWNISVTNDHGYVPLVVNICRSFPHSWLINGFVTRLSRRVPLVSCAETAYPSAAPEVTPVISGVRVTRSLVLCVCSVYRCLSLCPFSFSHCVVCSSSMYGFCLPLWYLQTLLAYLIATNVYKIIVVVNFITFTAGYHSNGRFPYGIWISSAAWRKWQ